mgnify:CR=1 FL=1
MSSIEASRDRLIADLKSALGHAEQFVGASATEGGEKLAEARGRVEKVLREARVRLEAAEAQAAATAKEAAAATEKSIREHPWTAVGISAAAGLVIGLLIGRK